MSVADHTASLSSVLVGRVVEDNDFPYLVVCDDCGATVGHARLLAQPAGGYLWEWRHTDPDHTCPLPPGG